MTILVTVASSALSAAVGYLVKTYLMRPVMTELAALRNLFATHSLPRPSVTAKTSAPPTQHRLVITDKGILPAKD